ncbi:MAG TPA: HisA/HisF-related TIM barrel protein, partial [Gemmatimonadota bacterium]
GGSIEVIPVLDVLAGRAVRADGGARSGYEPLRSVWAAPAAAAADAGGAPDAATGDPVELARAVRDGFGARTVYVAHLDAIAEASGAAHDRRPAPARPELDAACELVGRIAALGVDVWIDAGTGDPAAADRVLAAGASRVVVGLETVAGVEELDALPQERRLVFGLDVRSDGVVAAAPELRRLTPGAAAARAAAAGFRSILLLDLDRVGRSGGPALEALRGLRRMTPGVEWGVGGGVRGERDVAALEAAGAAWCLAGSALHHGRLRPRTDQVRSAVPAPRVSLQNAD